MTLLNRVLMYISIAMLVGLTLEAQAISPDRVNEKATGIDNFYNTDTMMADCKKITTYKGPENNPDVFEAAFLCYRVISDTLQVLATVEVLTSAKATCIMDEDISVHEIAEHMVAGYYSNTDREKVENLSAALFTTLYFHKVFQCQSF